MIWVLLLGRPSFRTCGDFPSGRAGLFVARSDQVERSVLSLLAASSHNGPLACGGKDVGENLRDPGGMETARLCRRGQVPGDVSALACRSESILGHARQTSALVQGADEDQEHLVRSR